jgi:L,D-transpeptidase ErfK/SrfK
MSITAQAGKAFIYGLALLALVLVNTPASAEILKPPPKLHEAPVKAEKSKAPAARQSLANAYAKDYVGEIQTYVAKYEDTMVQIARDYNVGFVELRAANPFLDPWIPGEGKKILIPTMHLLPRAPREGIVMNLAEMRMYAFMKPGQPPKSFPIGIGREGLLTPSGTTSVVRKKDGPVWRPTTRMRKENPALPAEVPQGPDNPMGTHALYLGWPEYAIHGTDKPYSIGRRSSSGCIRMYPENITQVFEMVPIGTPVTVVNQAVKLGWIGNKLYLEAHPTMEQADKMEVDGGLPGYVFPEEDMGIIVASAGEYARDLNWPLIRQIIRERRGYPVEIFRKTSSPVTVVKPVAVAEEPEVMEKITEKAESPESGKKEPLTTPN